MPGIITPGVNIEGGSFIFRYPKSDIAEVKRRSQGGHPGPALDCPVGSGELMAGGVGICDWAVEEVDLAGHRSGVEQLVSRLGSRGPRGHVLPKSRRLRGDSRSRRLAVLAV